MLKRSKLLVFFSASLSIAPCVAEVISTVESKAQAQQDEGYLAKIKENIYPILGATAAGLGSAAYWAFGKRRQGLQAAQFNRAVMELASAMASLPSSLSSSSSSGSSSDDTSYTLGKTATPSITETAALPAAVIAASQTLLELLQQAPPASARSDEESFRDSVRAAVINLANAELDAADIDESIRSNEQMQRKLELFYDKLTEYALEAIRSGRITTSQINLGNMSFGAKQIARFVKEFSNKSLRKYVLEFVKSFMRRKGLLTNEQLSSAEFELAAEPYLDTLVNAFRAYILYKLDEDPSAINRYPDQLFDIINEQTFSVNLEGKYSNIIRQIQDHFSNKAAA